MQSTSGAYVYNHEYNISIFFAYRLNPKYCVKWVCCYLNIVMITYPYETVVYVFQSPVFRIFNDTLFTKGGRSYLCMHGQDTYAHSVVKLFQRNKFDKSQYDTLVQLFELEMENVYKLYPDMSKEDAIRMTIMCSNIQSVAPETMRFNKMIKRMLYAVGAYEGAPKQQIADMNPLTCVPKS